MFYRRAFYVLSLGLHVPANWRSALLRSSGLPARCCNGQCTFIQPCQSSSQRCWCVTFPAQMPSNPPRHRPRAAGPGSLIYEPFGLVHQWGKSRRRRSRGRGCTSEESIAATAASHSILTRVRLSQKTLLAPALFGGRCLPLLTI